MKLFKTIFFFSTVLLFSCQSEQKQDSALNDSVYEEVDTTIVHDQDTSGNQPIRAATNPNKILVTCEGVGYITFDDSYESLSKKVGEANLNREKVMVDGKFYNTYCTKVWKGTAGELTINWQESKAPYQTIQNIVIDNPNSTYVLENGLKLGSNLLLVNKLNGKPFSLYGFGDKNKGTVVSYNGGNLENQISCIRPIFGLKIEADDLPKAEKVAADKGILSSDNPALLNVNPIIVKLVINSKR